MPSLDSDRDDNEQNSVFVGIDFAQLAEKKQILIAASAVNPRCIAYKVRNRK
jgi:hypothetical protein